MHKLVSRHAARAFAIIALVLGIASGVTERARADASGPYGGKLAFTVLRGDKPIGHHTITFREVGDETHVDIDIELVVKIGFLTVFRYWHRNREVWRNGELVSVATDSYDNGKEFEVKATQEADGLRVTTLTDERVLPSSSIPTSYWNPEILTNKNWLDTQRGIILDTNVEKVGSEDVALADGRVIEADRYEVTGDLKITVWYTPKGEWVKLSFPARGSDIEYVMTEGYTGTRLTRAQ